MENLYLCMFDINVSHTVLLSSAVGSGSGVYLMLIYTLSNQPGFPVGEPKCDLTVIML